MTIWQIRLTMVSSSPDTFGFTFSTEHTVHGFHGDYFWVEGSLNENSSQLNLWIKQSNWDTASEIKGVNRCCKVPFTSFVLWLKQKYSTNLTKPRQIKLYGIFWNDPAIWGLTSIHPSEDTSVLQVYYQGLSVLNNPDAGNFYDRHVSYAVMIVIFHVPVKCFIRPLRNSLIPGNKVENVLACVWCWHRPSMKVFRSHNAQAGKRWIHAWERKLLKHKQDVNLNPPSAHRSGAETPSPH